MTYYDKSSQGADYDIFLKQEFSVALVVVVGVVLYRVITLA